MPVKKKENGLLLYKGKPMVRSGNTIYYGNLTDKYIVVFTITATQKFGDMDLPTKVIIELQLTDPDLKPKDKLIKRSEKDGLYNAIDIGDVWLDRALSGK